MGGPGALATTSVEEIGAAATGPLWLQLYLPTARALSKVVEAVEGRIPVLVDGGIRRGPDVLSAVALGAAAVLIGRPYLWGLAVAGQRGVERVVDLLVSDLRRALALTGCPRLRDVDARLLAR